MKDIEYVKKELTEMRHDMLDSIEARFGTECSIAAESYSQIDAMALALATIADMSRDRLEDQHIIAINKILSIGQLAGKRLVAMSVDGKISEDKLKDYISCINSLTEKPIKAVEEFDK